MSEYAQHFADDDIDFAILPDLTDQDLEKIGVKEWTSPSALRVETQDLAGGKSAIGEASGIFVKT